MTIIWVVLACWFGLSLLCAPIIGRMLAARTPAPVAVPVATAATAHRAAHRTAETSPVRQRAYSA